MKFTRLAIPALIAALALSACGGGGDPQITSGTPSGGSSGSGSTGGTGGSTGTITWTPGVFPASSTFANRCAKPRTGVHPITGQSWPDLQGTLLAEKHFLRSWTNELYLWFSEVPDGDPAATPDILDYFDKLKTPAILSSGRAKDPFHYTAETNEYLASAENGTLLGYGIAWGLEEAYPPRKLMVQYVQPGSPAAAAGITRGAELLRADGYDVVNDATASGVDAINAAVFPTASGASHQFVFRERSGANRTLSMAAASVTFSPVPTAGVVVTAQGKVGYLLFNDHTASSEVALRGAIQQLQTAQVSALVLDLRYNSGGYLDIASELAYMIAGPARTDGRTFIKEQFNSKHPEFDPVTNQRLVPVPFHDLTQGFSVAGGLPLPTLDLPAVYVLTSEATCSASEAIINGLQGVGVTVYQFGGDTCGKPYGFYPEENCGTTYFSIQFRGVNDAGFGDYAEGFSPVRASAYPQTRLPGCAVSDDYTHELGDPQEGQLRAALDYHATAVCPATPPVSMGPQAAHAEMRGPPLRQPVQPWRSNFILR